MHPSIENANYFNDARTGEPAPDKITVWVENEDGSETEIDLPTKYEVCSVCNGEGKHVNPSIDCNGLSRDDFYDDPDFAEDYMSGKYDVICNNCQGKRVEKIVDRENTSPELLEAYDNEIQADADYRAERLAEIRMGC